MFTDILESQEFMQSVQDRNQTQHLSAVSNTNPVIHIPDSGTWLWFQAVGSTSSRMSVLRDCYGAVLTA